jgi:hypothetical protein
VHLAQPQQSQPQQDALPETTPPPSATDDNGAVEDEGEEEQIEEKKEKRPRRSGRTQVDCLFCKLLVTHPLSCFRPLIDLFSLIQGSKRNKSLESIRFAEGDDVVVKWVDGLYYGGKCLHCEHRLYSI